MQNELPEWAMEEAVTFEKDLPSKITGANRVFIRAVLARALLAAEQRGLEKAAKVALTRSPDDDNLDWQVRQQVAAAIRQLGEEP